MDRFDEANPVTSTVIGFMVVGGHLTVLHHRDETGSTGRVVEKTTPTVRLILSYARP